MNRLLAACLALAVLASAPLAAEDGVAAATPDLTGKAVIVQRANWYIGVRENVRFATVGNHSFIIIPRPKSDAEQWDHWMPLDKIEGIKVFDTVDAAVAYAKKMYPQYEKPEQAQIPADATTSRTIRVDGDKIQYESKEVSLDELATHLGELSPGSKILIAADAQTPYQRLAEIHAVASKHQVTLAIPAADAPKPTADSEDGATVSGVVTLKGQPVTGRIFFHTSGDQFFGCRIDEEGRYTVTPPTLGDYRVTIEGSRVPSRYTQLDSGLRATISDGTNVADFELHNQ